MSGTKIFDSQNWDYWRRLDFSKLSMKQIELYAKALNEILDWKIYCPYPNIPIDGAIGFEGDVYTRIHNRVSPHTAKFIRFERFYLNRLRRKLDFTMNFFIPDSPTLTLNKEQCEAYKTAMQCAIMLLNEVCNVNPLELSDIRALMDGVSFQTILKSFQKNLLWRIEKRRYLSKIAKLEKEGAIEIQPDGKVIWRRKKTGEFEMILEDSSFSAYMEMSAYQKVSLIDFDDSLEAILFGMEIAGKIDFVKLLGKEILLVPDWRMDVENYNSQFIGKVTHIREVWRLLASQV